MKVVILPNDLKTSKQNGDDAMIRIGGIPVFFHTIMLFEKRGFYDFIICDNSSTHEIRDYLNANKEKIKGLKIRLLKVPSDIKSGKILSLCQKYGLENAFFVAPNDTITDLDPEKMLSVHRQNARASTVFVAEKREYFGALGITDNKYESKIVNGGFYIFEPEAIEYISSNEQIDPELITRLAEDDELFVFSDECFVQRATSVN